MIRRRNHDRVDVVAFQDFAIVTVAVRRLASLLFELFD